ncbi:MAG: GNAT family N-acetyltransferase [Nocardiopsaceae bacterium]|jgi:hypothetical protein|nr:GNAT family N-acetyltransferase [Nocardiopsaceae bacterium]
MAWELTGDLGRFLGAAGEFLRSRPAEHTVLLTACETLRAGGLAAFGAPPLFGWWQQPGGGVSAAFLHTPPYPVALTAAAAGQAAALAGVLAGRRRELAGVNSDVSTAQPFAVAWQRETGQQAHVHRRMREFRLAGLQPPPPVPGGPWTATTGDLPLLVQWATAFARDVGDLGPDPERQLTDRLSHGGLTFWEEEGRPISLAGLTRQVAGQMRVGPVYTPPEFRRRGFAAAVTAAVSRAALAAGALEVLLFTDLANPTSNALYQRLGYRPVSDYVSLAFGPG